MSEAAEQPETPPQPPDQRKGNFISGGTFYGDVIGYQAVNLPPPPAPMPLDQALRLLDQLPLDDIPDPQTLPEPHRMPFAVNPLFVGRADSLRRIAAQLKAGGTIAVTTGIGGVGKTQLAIEAAHRYGRYFGGGVFWLSFADPGAIASEVADCGRRIGAFHEAEKLDLDAQVQRTLARWASNLPRLLVFDNCEDEALLRQWRPTTGACRVLVTSRKQTSWSVDLGVKLLPLEVLAREESIRLLQQLAPQLSSEEAEQIAEELGDLPLALHLAGCYLAFYDDITPQTYLANLRAINPLTHWSMQGDTLEGMPTDREPHVARAFALSFERLNPEVPTDALAQALLARAACFAPGEPFAQTWLAVTVEVTGGEEEQTRTRTRAIKRLLGLGLLESVDKDRLRLHRLLVAYAVLAIYDTTALPAVGQVVINVANQANETDALQVMQSMLPHLRHLLQQVDKHDNKTVEGLCASLGYYLQTIGSYLEAQPLLERALVIRQRVLGINHLDTAVSLSNLAELYRLQGVYDQALLLYEQALVIRERILGNNHTLVAQSLNNLAAQLYILGSYERALLLYERALAIYEQVSEFDHTDTATTLNNLAELYNSQGAYDQALPLYERALAMRERMLGDNHTLTAQSLNNLAAQLYILGSYERALLLYQRGLAIYERVLGAEHPDTATILNNIAELYNSQGAYEQALPLYERALTIRERVFGNDHPQTAGSFNNLAGFYANQGQFTLALPLLEKALRIFQARLGLQHPDTILVQQSLVGIRQAAAIATLPETLLAALPKAVRAALQAQDNAAFQQAMIALMPQEQQAVVVQLQAAGILDDPLEDFKPLLQAIAAVAQGNDKLRTKVEGYLDRFEQHGSHLTAPVRAIWAGQRDPAALTAGLDATDAALIQRVLALLEPGAG